MVLLIVTIFGIFIFRPHINESDIYTLMSEIPYESYAWFLVQDEEGNVITSSYDALKGMILRENVKKY